MILPSPSPTDPAWKAPSMAASAQTGQLSPVSSGLDLSMDGSSAPTTAHSASSSCTDSWSIGYADQDDGDDDAHWDHLDRVPEDARAIPKLEPTDDDVNLSEVKLAPCTASALRSPVSSGSQAKHKRPRGRPRKNSLTTPTVSATKVTKGRSKTGCITCRKRKKKCDEAKPRCMNCEKNAVVCEGYHEKQLWRSGKERAEEEAERLRLESLPTITLQPIFKGVETKEDWIFWRHYVNHFSNVLTVEGEAKNAFKDVILQLANQHQGLMHSVLALSSKHIDFGSPYGVRILQGNPGTSRESLQQRAEFHHGEALKRLCEDIGKSIGKDDPEYQTVLAARYGQILCLLLRTRADGNPRGEHRLHLQAYQSLIQQSPPEDTAFYTFITEFFQYHVYADDLFWHPESLTKRLSSESWQPSVPIEAPRLLGVADGLFKHLSQITNIRNTIRANMDASVVPLVDYITLFQAVDIDAAIREWSPRWPPGDSRDRVAPLYKQMMWVYLFRTIYPPSTNLPRRSTLGALPVAPPTSSAPQRRASMAASVRFRAVAAPNATVGGSPRGSPLAKISPPPRKPSRTSSMHELDSRAAAGPAPACGSPGPPSPPPTRCPTHDDGRITLAVEESLSILESFKPSDPSQTLLLMPCLIIGTSCFEPAQRNRIRTAVRLVRGYTGLRNCDRVREVLEKVWALMDEGDWVSVWDWQGVARRMGLDFLCA
ncbi:fungal specific transcription factor domain-containing protein [Hirsutella rhossiliensis]|uniref:Fungal specific transcription factor domain-containing protein n=1 Tax=Hirsutella rhossiliensis TaxID=111463 RepID=A0A9P8SEC7_9HYPO|nr:fungal specific transcription factor domain-containing protein [Hirsutella rhossiliensis]KAH0959703.1 fungal specific transcription factor domain-containing protein [Hirsutella rhossiliensis]